MEYIYESIFPTDDFLSVWTDEKKFNRLVSKNLGLKSSIKIGLPNNISTKVSVSFDLINDAKIVLTFVSNKKLKKGELLQQVNDLIVYEDIGYCKNYATLDFLNKPDIKMQNLLQFTIDYFSVENTKYFKEYLNNKYNNTIK